MQTGEFGGYLRRFESNSTRRDTSIPLTSLSYRTERKGEKKEKKGGKHHVTGADSLGSEDCLSPL